jgi:hypothetical protein
MLILNIIPFKVLSVQQRYPRKLEEEKIKIKELSCEGNF